MRWDEPTFVGAAGKMGSLALAGREDWKKHSEQAGAVVPSGGKGGPFVPIAAIRSQPRGATQVHYVNALDPGSEGWVLAAHDLGEVVPAGRP